MNAVKNEPYPGGDGTGRAALRWNDRVYGPTELTDSDILHLISCPTFQRLRGIRQAGPSTFAHPFKTVTRFEHSLGVYVLLGRLGAARLECVAGLLHDISHTAFSHAVDFLFDTEEQAHHETLKPRFLNRPDLAAAIQRLGYSPEQFYDDSDYPLLERPLPWLCADRLDYFLRDARSCNELTPLAVSRILDDLVVVDDMICLQHIAVARDLAAAYGEMNRRWWSGPVEAFIYNEFADAMREGLRTGVLSHDDLLGDDEHVLSRLRAARNPLIQVKLDRIRRIPPEALKGYRPRVVPKMRWLDPTVVDEHGVVRRLSEYDKTARSA